MTIDEILATAPPSVKRMTPEAQQQWAQRQLGIRTSPEYLAKVAQWKAYAAALTAVKADAFVQNFIAMTPQQVANYVDANTETLAETRALLKKMGQMLLVLARREYR